MFKHALPRIRPLLQLRNHYVIVESCSHQERQGSGIEKRSGQLCEKQHAPKRTLTRVDIPARPLRTKLGLSSAMGQEDAKIQAFVWTWLVPALLCYATYKMFGKGFLTKTYKWTYVRWMSRLAKTFDRVYDEHKKQLFEDLHNISEKAKPRAINILEVAIGAGTNFKYFPDGCNVICVDPNPYFESYIKSQQKVSSHVNITEFVVGKCEDLDVLPDGRLDAVVCTLGLCSVGDVRESLKEIRRVLKPGGKFFFIEHVKADKKSWFLRNLQRVVHRPWRLISNGCNVLSETLSHVEAAGFSEVSADRFKAKMPFLLMPMRPTLIGTAVK